AGRPAAAADGPAREAPDGEGEAAIEVADLTRRFGDFTAVDRVSFTVRRGEIFGLLGPNGAGKSTIFKMLCGLLPPSDGQARVAGTDLRHGAAAARQQLGYMAQSFSLYAGLTVRQNLGFFAGAYGLSRRQARDRRAALAETFGLDDHLDTPAGALPLGFKQRLSLAAAILHRPAILFLDEPTSGVDPLTRREFWLTIAAMAEAGTTVLVTTHFMDEADYCDRLAVVYRGQLLALETPDGLKDRFADGDTPRPTIEDAFIALIERGAEDAERERAA
ncbi:MAG: ATP-binding cassette domain-containing protein, partial [Alphaproteobacteria bacterium]|nr:ATP-binding cassette domain-containing protein [Alphaproteobacteria bacterium]